jgi:hypothetical protein
VNKHLAVLLFAALSQATAQTQTYATAKAEFVVRTTKAMHYRPGGTSKIQFQGTDLMQRGSGEAKVEAKKSNIQIDAKFEGMEDATKFGLEYLTYVMWAVSPQGRAVNLGEVSLDHGKGHVKAFTDLQTFGMIVTAEPYSAVSQPGNMVVMENSVRRGRRRRGNQRQVRTAPQRHLLLDQYAHSGRHLRHRLQDSAATV